MTDPVPSKDLVSRIDDCLHCLWIDRAGEERARRLLREAMEALRAASEPAGECDHETFNYCWNCKTTREQRAAQPPGADPMRPTMFGGAPSAVVEAVADALVRQTDAEVIGFSGPGCQCREYVGDALKIESYCPVHGDRR